MTKRIDYRKMFFDLDRRYYDLCTKVSALLNTGDNAWLYGPDFLDHGIDLSWTEDYTQFWSWDKIICAICENPGGLFDDLADPDGKAWPEIQGNLNAVTEIRNSPHLAPEQRRGRIAWRRLAVIAAFLNMGFPPKGDVRDGGGFVPTFRLRRGDEIVQTHPGIVPYDWAGSKDDGHPDGWTLFEHTGTTDGPSALRGMGITFNTRDKAAWAGMTFTDMFRDLFTMCDGAGDLMSEVDGSRDGDGD